MDLNLMQDFLKNSFYNSLNIIILGEKKVGKSCFINMFSRIPPSAQLIKKFDFKENEISSFMIDEFQKNKLNFFEIKNIQFFSEYNLDFTQKNNLLFILTDNLKDHKQIIIQLSDIAKGRVKFEKCFLVRTKCEINYEKSFYSNESFALSLGKINYKNSNILKTLGFCYKELSYLNEMLSQEDFNQVFKEGTLIKPQEKYGSNIIILTFIMTILINLLLKIQL